MASEPTLHFYLAFRANPPAPALSFTLLALTAALARLCGRGEVARRLAVAAASLVALSLVASPNRARESVRT